MKKLLIVLPTFKRNTKAISLIEKIVAILIEFPTTVDLKVLDDDPASNLGCLIDAKFSNYSNQISYKRNKKNLGQGVNWLNHISASEDYEYIWTVADDDSFDPKLVTESLRIFFQSNSDVAIFEFRQGRSFKYGTFFNEEDIRSCNGVGNIECSIEAITRFGKVSNVIHRYPSKRCANFLMTRMVRSMYQDKAAAIFSYLESNDRSVEIFPRVLVYGDADYGNLRYSTRVFANLPIVVSLTLNEFNVPYDRRKNLTHPCPLDALRWWLFGVRQNINNGDIRYSSKKFAAEILFGWVYALVGIISPKWFQPK